MATKKSAPKKVEAKKTVKVVAKSASKKPTAKPAAKPVAKKPVAKVASKSAPKKATVKPVVKKAVAKPVAKKVAVKPVVKKATVKPVVKKATVKPVVKKATVKPVVKKATVKPVVKKATVKPVVKKAAVKSVVKKVAVKPVVKKAAVKSVVKKAAVKPVVKKAAVKPVVKKAAAKPVVKKATAKPVVKKAVSSVSKPMVKKEPAKVTPNGLDKKGAVKVEKPEKPVKPAKVAKPKSAKAAPTKTVIANNSIPKKSDVFKTTTFGVANLKNDSGKVIAHRKTADLKRKNNDFGDVKKLDVEYTRSILDMVPDDSKTSYRYSDDDLQEFREIIERKLDTAKAELQYLQGVIMRKDESGTDDTENKYQNMEDGSASMDREQFNQLAGRQVAFISHLEQALVRIENKTYGICRDTGKLIDKARLRAVPHATLSIEAKNAKK
jgi:RNA polymerase-binding transcription factor DksA